MDIRKLRKLASSMGADVEVDHYQDSSEITITAPDGKQWSSGNCVHMTEQYWRYIKSGDGSRDSCVRRLYERVNQGLENLDIELNP